MTDYDLKAESQRLLELTGQQHRIKTLADRSRGRLDAAIRNMFEASGVVGKFKIRGTGEVRLDGIDALPKPYVANAETYANHVAERSPENVVATIEVPAKMLEDALAALELASIEQLGAKVTVREAYITKHMADIELEENPEHAAHPSTEPKWLAFDTTVGEQVPGLAGRQPNPVLKVVLDRDHKIVIEDDAAAEDDVIARDLGFGMSEQDAKDDVELGEMADAAQARDDDLSGATEPELQR